STAIRSSTRPTARGGGTCPSRRCRRSSRRPRRARSTSSSRRRSVRCSAENNDNPSREMTMSTAPDRTSAATIAGDDAGLRIGTAPDSWGVWFPDDPNQVPWQRFLDEVVEAGYTWIELGPYGYLPTDPHQLEDELGKRGLKLSGGTVFTGFHKSDDEW